MKTGRKTWAFEVRQLDKHADLWVQEIQQAIDRCVDPGVVMLIHTTV